MANSVLLCDGGSLDYTCFLHMRCLTLLLIKNGSCSLNKSLQWKLSLETNQPSEFCLTFYNALLAAYDDFALIWKVRLYDEKSKCLALEETL